MLGRLVLVFVALAVVTAPLASAGPGAEVDTLHRERECASASDSGGYWESGTIYERPPPPPPVNETPPPANGTSPPPTAPEDNDSGNETPTPVGEWYHQSWWHSASSACASETTYASASARDAEGDVATSRAYAWNGSTSDKSSQQMAGSSWYYSGQSYSSSDEAWSRSDSRSDGRAVAVDSVAGDANVVSGCSESWSTSGGRRASSGSGPQGSWYWEETRSSDRGTWGCRDGVDIAAAEREAGAAREDRCTYANDGTRTSDGRYRENGTRTDEHGSGAFTCRSGAAAQAQGEDVFLGREDRCEGDRHATSGPVWTPNGTAHRSTEWQTSECFQGVVVDGPAGAETTAGMRSESSSYCADGACAWWGSSWGGATFAWQDNPFGPREQAVGTWLG